MKNNTAYFTPSPVEQVYNQEFVQPILYPAL